MFKSVTISKKLQYSILVLTIAIGSIIYFSVNGLNTLTHSTCNIVKDSKKLENIGNVIASHEKFVGALEQALKQNRLCISELDPSKCGLGTWWKSFSKSPEYQNETDELKKDFDKMLIAHKKLHNIAQEYNDNYIFFDRDLKEIILQQELNHLNGVMKMSKAILNKKTIYLQTDSNKCAFGKWFFKYKKSDTFKNLDKKLQTILLKLEIPHNNLHNNFKILSNLQKNGEFEKAKNYYENSTLAYLESIQKYMTQIINIINQYDENNKPIEKRISEESVKDVKFILTTLKGYEKVLDNEVRKSEKDSEVLIEKIDLEILVMSIIIILVLIGKAVIVNGVVHSIKNFQKGINSFFDYLANPEKKVDKIDIESEDEFGQMSRSVNDSIQISMKMHGEMAQLMMAVDKNVITSETDDKGIITYVSQAFCEISGYTKEELLGKPHNIVRHPDMPKEIFKELWKTIQGDETWVGEVKNLRKDGTFYWVHTIISPKCTKGGASCGYTAIRYDISDKKVVEDLTANLEKKVENQTKDLKKQLRIVKMGERKQNEIMQALSATKNEVEAIYKHTRDSIEYASLIQGALIPLKGAMQPYFKDHFVTWTPKDTVGGDIWLFDDLRHEDECLLFFIDCTGHGVPGAFVTMIVKAVEREVISMIKADKDMDISPAWIMSYFNSTIKKLLRQEDKDSLSNAGWDGGIIYYNRRDQILKFAGAETPLFYMTIDGEFKTVKGNRYSVGYKKCDPNYQYKETIIEVEEGMKFYCTTDGYLDQNGGEKDFPFGKKRFGNIIKKHHTEPMAELQTIFQLEMMEYEGAIENNDRNDDMTVIAFEIGAKSDFVEDTIEEIVKYEGLITQNVIASCMDNIEVRISDMNLLGTISTVTIEYCQNMMNYSKNSDVGSRQIIPMGTIEVQYINNSYYDVIATNIISVDDKNKIEPKLLEIQSLDKAGIKKRYRELRKSGQNTHDKGGGIGLYEIAKASDTIEYNFEAINEDKYEFTMKSMINIKKIKGV